MAYTSLRGLVHEGRKSSSGKGPAVYFIKKNGGTFRKVFKSRSSASRAVKGWRGAGGKIDFIGN